MALENRGQNYTWVKLTVATDFFRENLSDFAIPLKLFEKRICINLWKIVVNIENPTANNTTIV